MNEANAIIVICHERPFNLGHVGWGFEYPDGTWCVGAVEGNLFVDQPNGFWSRRAANFQEAIHYFQKMQEKFGTTYNEYKYLTANSKPNPQLADKMMEWVRNQPYQLTGRNCMDSTYDILCAFSQGGNYSGGVLPKPSDNWYPNDWYNLVPYNDRQPI